MERRLLGNIVSLTVEPALLQGPPGLVVLRLRTKGESAVPAGECKSSFRPARAGKRHFLSLCTSIMSRGLLGVVVPSPVGRQRVPWGGRGAAGGSCRKRLVDPPTSSGSPADGTQLAGSFPLAPAKSPFLGGEPRKPEFELAGCPWGDPCSSPGSSFSICKTHRLKACPWGCSIQALEKESLPFSHTLYGSLLSQVKYPAPPAGM